MPDHEGTPSWEELYRSTAAERDRLAEQVAANRARYEDARRERDEYRAEVEALRAAIACRTCTGWGFLGYPDQPDKCPTCGDLREAVVEAAGGY